MSVIDLVKRAELQLNPVLDLKDAFDDATETFFGALEAQE